MVKVIIEKDSGERVALAGDFALVSVASDDKNSNYNVSNLIQGKFSKYQFPHFLAHAALDNIRAMFKTETPAERIIQMIEFETHIKDLIVDEIAKNRDTLDLSEKTKFVLDLVEGMKD